MVLAHLHVRQFHVLFQVPWVVELMYRAAGRGVFIGFSPPSPPLFSVVHQGDGCLSCWGHGGSWLCCQVLPAIGAVSILELAANSGSSRMASYIPCYPVHQGALQVLVVRAVLCVLVFQVVLATQAHPKIKTNLCKFMQIYAT